MRQSSLETQYVEVEVDFDVDPTEDVVRMAFIVWEGFRVDPEEVDWFAAEWNPSKPPYKVQVLVGPEEEAALDKGFYAVWIDVQDNPENPKRSVGWLDVT